jgi:hypothetical protein
MLHHIASVPQAPKPRHGLSLHGSKQEAWLQWGKHCKASCWRLNRQTILAAGTKPAHSAHVHDTKKQPTGKLQQCRLLCDATTRLATTPQTAWQAMPDYRHTLLALLCQTCQPAGSAVWQLVHKRPHTLSTHARFAKPNQTFGAPHLRRAGKPTTQTTKAASHHKHQDKTCSCLSCCLWELPLGSGGQPHTSVAVELTAVAVAVATR